MMLKHAGEKGVRWCPAFVKSSPAIKNATQIAMPAALVTRVVRAERKGNRRIWIFLPNHRTERKRNSTCFPWAERHLLEPIHASLLPLPEKSAMYHTLCEYCSPHLCKLECRECTDLKSKIRIQVVQLFVSKVGVWITPGDYQSVNNPDLKSQIIHNIRTGAANDALKTALCESPS